MGGDIFWGEGGCILLQNSSKPSRTYKKLPEREGTMGCLLLRSPLFYNNIFLFFGLTTYWTLVSFDWLDHLVQCSNVLTTNFNLLM